MPFYPPLKGVLDSRRGESKYLPPPPPPRRKEAICGQKRPVRQRLHLSSPYLIDIEPSTRPNITIKSATMHGLRFQAAWKGIGYPRIDDPKPRRSIAKSLPKAESCPKKARERPSPFARCKFPERFSGAAPGRFDNHAPHPLARYRRSEAASPCTTSLRCPCLRRQCI